MKFGLWILIFSLGVWSVEAHFWVPLALADGVDATNHPVIPTPTVQPLQPVPYHQDTAQKDTKDTNKDGQDKSNMLGALAIAAGAAMVAAGMAMTPPNMALIAAGMALIAAGMAALAAGKQAGENKDQAKGLQQNLSNITSPPTDSALGPGGKGAGIKIDHNFLHDGKTGDIFKDLEKRTGIKPEDLINGLNAGLPVTSMLAAAPRKIGLSEGQMEKMLAEAAPMSGKEALDRLGLSAGELNSMGENVVPTGGGDANKTAAAATGPSLEDLLAKAPKADDFAGNTNLRLPAGVSADVQAALDKNGITSRTIFEMVHDRYVAKAPLLFGVQKKSSSSTTDNPFANLEVNGVDL